MKFIKRFWWLFCLFCLIGGGVAYFKSKSAEAEYKKNLYTIKKTDLREDLSLSGEIDAEEKAELKFQASGLLTWVGVKAGDEVRKYQAVASLDKRELQNSFNQYLNSYMKERWDFEQGIQDNQNWETIGMTDLARDTVKRTLEKNQFDLNNSVLAVEAKNLALKFATIYAPFEGIVTKVDVPIPGTNVTPAGAVFNIVNPKSLYFSASADQTEVVNFRPGMMGKIVLEAFPDVEIDSTVSLVSFAPKTDETGTVYEIKMAFSAPNIAEGIKLGMTGDANFVIKEKKNVLAIPEQYLEKDGEQYFVDKVVNGNKSKVAVEIGDIVDGMAIIISGLNEGEVIYHKP